MFKVTEERTFTHDVKVKVPTDGGHVEQTFKTTFRVVDIDELEDTATLEGQTKTLQRVVKGMDDLVDESEKKLDYSDELRDKLIRVPFVRQALLRTYLKAIAGASSGN